MTTILGNTGEWEYVIGLEIHAQVKSKSKLFSSAPTEYGADPNTQVSLVDAGMPGMLPVLNEYCVEQAVRTGLSLHSKINKRSIFDRKNYFYPDLPQGYQISQFYHPIISHGHVNILGDNDEEKKIRIHHIHLEQDAGKSMHDQSASNSFIDLNRAGIALMEIVSEPDMRSPQDAAEFIKKLRAILRYIGSCDGDMEKGSLRCDANVSVRKPGDELGTRCEIKNVNSIRNVIKAIEYEAKRQIEIIESGGHIIQETRLFDADEGVTRSMRNKEDANDYRYFPDPDLLPLIITEEYINKISQTLPELPDAKIERYVNELNISKYDAEVLVADKNVAHYFEEVTTITNDPKMSANWVSSELFSYLNKEDIGITDSKIAAKQLAELIGLIKNETISGKIAKQVFELMADSGDNPTELIERHGLKQITDTGELSKIAEEVLMENPKNVESFKGGKEKIFGFFVGQVMKKTGGKASPDAVNKILKDLLSKI